MYVRTKGFEDVQIGKVLQEVQDSHYFAVRFNDGIYESNSNYDISNANYNPISLIEVGDIVVDKNNRKYEITEIKVYEDMGICLISKFSLDGNNYTLEFGESDIKEILTKEQFSLHSYKLGKED